MTMNRICVTTSDNYHHCLPVFFKCYNKHWGDFFDLVGYKKPDDLPDNCRFVSLGEQRGPQYFTDDLSAYFKKQPQFFFWCMEDCFIKSFNERRYHLTIAKYLTPGIAKISLVNEAMRRPHKVDGQYFICENKTDYLLSTQPAIWNRDFLLKWMKPGFSPWQFETQVVDDFRRVIGPVENIVFHNEGVRKHNIHELNLEGLEL